MILQNLFQTGAKQSKMTFLMSLAAALIVSGFFVSVALAAITTLSVSAPNGGEDWRGARDITWSTTGGAPGDSIDIVVIDEGLGFSHEVAADVAYDASPFSWYTATEADGANYKIRILKAGTATVYDTSDTVFEIDNTDPVTTYAIAPVSPDGLNGWYDTVPTVTLTCADGTGSGCNNTYYKWDGAASWTTYTVPFLALEGEHILSFYSDDNATDAVGLRNEETVQIQTIKVDTAVPTVAVTSNTTDGYYNVGDTIDVTLNFSEAVSSTDTLTVNLNSGGACTIPTFANQTTVNCIYTVLGGHNSSDLTVTSIVPDSGVVEDVAGNDSTLLPTSNMADTSAIVVDTTSPIPFTVGNVTSTGGTVVAGWFNSTNTEVNMLVPIDNDLSLTGGTVQLQAEADGTYEDAGNPYTILVGFLGNDISLSLTEAQIEALTGFSEGDNLQFRAVITDRAGNPTTGTESLVSLDVDQTLPSVNAGTDKEVNFLVAQDAITSDGGSGLNTHSWTQFSGAGVLTFGTPTTVDTTISAVPDDIYVARLTVTDMAGNSASDDIDFAWDTADPITLEVTPVPTPTNDTAPDYTFSVSSVKQLPTSTGGGIVFGGGCSSATVFAVAGNNTITLNALADGIYGACTITVTDAADNVGGTLTLSSFEIDTAVANVFSITTIDANADGMVDTAAIVFTDEMKDSTFVAGDFTIGGIPATTFTTGTADDATITLSHGGVAGTEAKTVAYTVGTVTDLAGNVRASFSSGSTDEAKPVLLFAKTMTTTSIQVTFSEDLAGGTVNGTGDEFAVAGYAVSAASETAPGIVTLTVATMPTDATPTVTYTANGPLNDLAIVPNTAVTPTTVTAVDEVAPTLSSVTISSNNDGNTDAPEWAKVGDIATLIFTSSEPIATPTVTIGIGTGHTLTNIGGNTWQYNYEFVSGDVDGPVPFSIEFTDLSSTPNTGLTVTTTGDASTVFFDEVAPTVDAGTNKEVNAVVAQAATVSDPDPASGIATYLWTNQTPGVGIITFGSATAEDTTISADTDGTYTIRLTVTDNAGNVNFDELTFIWDTTNPEPLTSSPSDGSTGVAITAGTAMVTYDEPIMLLDNSRVLLVRDSDDASFKGTVAVSGLSPAVLNIDYTGLAFGTKYRINVKSNALEDVAGNNLATSFISYFTTEIDTIPPVVNSFSASSITTTGATLNVTTDESATCSYATTDSAYSSMTAFDGPNTGTSHTAVLSGLTSSTGHDYFVRCADTTAETNTMTTSAHVSFTTLTPDTTGPVISNIQTPIIGKTTATITWTTDENATSRVEYGLTSAYGNALQSNTSPTNTSHSAGLTGLSAGTVYHFIVISEDAVPNSSTSGDNTFTTEVALDTTAPSIPVFTTSSATIDADTYTVAGTVADDDGTRVVSLYNGATLAGTASVPAGDIVWSIVASLTQDNTNVFTASADDEVGNTSGVSASVTIIEATAVGDTVAPAVPVISGANETVDADVYTLSGTAGADTPSDGSKTITIYREGTVVGSIVLPEGNTAWSLVVPLIQEDTNTFTAYSTDEAGNTSSVSNTRTITDEVTLDVTPPVITLLGVNPQTLTVGGSYVELGATASDDMDGDISIDLVIDSSAINMAVAGTYLVTYNVSDSSSNGATEETRTVIVEEAFDDTATLVVTGIDAVRTFAIADNTFENGWAWTFHVTVPTSETDFAMKFDDFISGANTLLAATNIRYYTAQSSLHANTGTAVTIAGADAYPASVVLDDDLSTNTAGRQIDVVVETRVPSGTPGGSYGTSYGVASGM